jgi:hypothetical protein
VSGTPGNHAVSLPQCSNQRRQYGQPCAHGRQATAHDDASLTASPLRPYRHPSGACSAFWDESARHAATCIGSSSPALRIPPSLPVPPGGKRTGRFTLPACLYAILRGEHGSGRPLALTVSTVSAESARALPPAVASQQSTRKPDGKPAICRAFPKTPCILPLSEMKRLAEVKRQGQGRAGTVRTLPFEIFELPRLTTTLQRAYNDE